MGVSVEAFAPRRASVSTPLSYREGTRLHLSASTTAEVSTAETTSEKVSTRILGSQELLMAPRQYSLSKDTFPSMNHVSCTVLSATPQPEVLEQALEFVMESHPLLRARISGDGEPNKRIDLFQMVREGEPNPMTFVADKAFSGSDVLAVIDVDDDSALENSWKQAFARDLDNGSWCDVHKGPLWKLELHRTKKGQSCALLLSFNHAISDQSSANRMMDQILKRIAEIEDSSKPLKKAAQQDMPVALEDSVLGMEQRWSDIQAGGISPGTISYVAGKAAEGFRDPVILPDNAADASSSALGALSIISGNTAGGQDEEKRASVVEFRTLSKDTTTALLDRCRREGVSISHALTAAVALTATDFIGESKERNYKVLQSLDMRRFGAQLDKGESVACMAGSMDLMHGPLPDGLGKALRQGKGDKQRFWDLARDGKKQTEEFVASDGPSHAVRVFDFAMTIADLNNLVYLTAQSKDTKGRAYSAGLTNVGVYERQIAFQYSEDDTERDALQIEHGKYAIQDVFFATPHVQSGCLYPVSCLTVGGELKFTFNPISPVVSSETNMKFADSFVDLLEVMAETKEPSLDTIGTDGEKPLLPPNALTIATSVLGLAAVLSHAGAWSSFFTSVAQMKANSPDEEFWAALNFWIFFAVGHPILQPILWISDV